MKLAIHVTAMALLFLVIGFYFANSLINSSPMGVIGCGAAMIISCYLLIKPIKE